MVSQLNSAASIYSSEQLQAPQGFDDFVTTAANTNGTKFTLSLSRFGKGTCTVAATSISCANDFPELGAVTFTTQSGAVIGNITCSTAKGGNC
jgi:hypothetical protein